MRLSAAWTSLGRSDKLVDVESCSTDQVVEHGGLRRLVVNCFLRVDQRPENHAEEGDHHVEIESRVPLARPV